MGEVIKINKIAKNKTKLADNEIKCLQSFNFSTIDIDPIPKKLEI